MARGRYSVTVASVFKDKTEPLTIHIEQSYYNNIRELGDKLGCNYSLVLTELIYLGLTKVKTIHVPIIKLQRQYIVPVSLIKEIKKLAADKGCKLSDLINTCLLTTDWETVSNSISHLSKNI